jgi:hypothetical protein
VGARHGGGSARKEGGSGRFLGFRNGEYLIPCRLGIIDQRDCIH